MAESPLMAGAREILVANGQPSHPEVSHRRPEDIPVPDCLNRIMGDEAMAAATRRYWQKIKSESEWVHAALRPEWMRCDQAQWDERIASVDADQLRWAMIMLMWTGKPLQASHPDGF